MFFFFYGYGDHRDLHVLTPSFPTRRSSDLLPELVDDVQIVHGVSAFVRFEICRGALAAVGGAGPIGLRDEETPAGEQEPAPPQLISACRLRSEEHTSELQSLMRISYAGFCLKKKKT